MIKGRTKPITKREFMAYEKVRNSGVINMYATNVVASLSGLDKETITMIMAHYEELDNKFNTEETK